MAIFIKDVITSDKWIITKVLQGYNNRVRIDAKTRHYKPDGCNFFSGWAFLDYINRLRRSVGKPNITITHY